MKATEILGKVRKELIERLKSLVEQRGGKVSFTILWEEEEDSKPHWVLYTDLPTEFYEKDCQAEPYFIYEVEKVGDNLEFIGNDLNGYDYTFNWVEVSVIATIIDLIEERLK